MTGQFMQANTVQSMSISSQRTLLHGPFKYMHSNWRFEDTPGGCKVHFHVDFEFKNRILQGIIGVVFGEAVQRMVRAFETRADALYGPRA